MFKANKCCCCIPIKAGAYLIGAIHLFYLVIFIMEFHILDAALNFFCGTTFAVMVFKDTQFTRMCFFAAFQTYVLLILALELYTLVFPFEDQQEAMDVVLTRDCKQLEINEGGYENTVYKDLAECKEAIKSSSIKFAFVFIILIFLFQLHFCAVLYAHWKKAPYSKSKGGCESDLVEGDIQM